MTKPPLTSAALDAEFEAWIWPGRDARGIRFGQHLCIEYDFVPREVFSCENTASVYVALCEYLQDVQR